jgi:uncharacterized protein (TIGR01319 family)
MTGKREIMLVDFGSTFTKAAIVSLPRGELLARAQRPTTLDTDLMDGLVAVQREVRPRRRDIEIRACSSAGGGLRLAVVGLEPRLTIKAATQVALSAGARVVHTAGGVLDDHAVARLADAKPDLILLAGGTDGGNRSCITANAHRLAQERIARSVVVAGNVDARSEVAAAFARHRVAAAVVPNLLPEVGVLDPGPARAAIRRMFLEHVIGGDRFSRRAQFRKLVRMPTPDAALQGVGLAARAVFGSSGDRDLMAIDLGGATTDVYSFARSAPDHAAASRSFAGRQPAARSVEADIGMRWSAGGVIEAAGRSGLIAPAERAALREAARIRSDCPTLVARNRAELELDFQLARLALRIAVLRHAGELAVHIGREQVRVERTDHDVSNVEAVIASGGFLHSGIEPARWGQALAASLAPAARKLLPGSAEAWLDRDYVLAFSGLLADDQPQAGIRLLETSLERAPASQNVAEEATNNVA